MAKLMSAVKNLYTEKLQSEEGYIGINLGKTSIVCRYNYITYGIYVRIRGIGRQDYEHDRVSERHGIHVIHQRRSIRNAQDLTNDQI